MAGQPAAPREDKVRLSLGLIREAPRLLALDRVDRSDFLRYFYRRYEDAPVEQVRTDSASSSPSDAA